MKFELLNNYSIRNLDERNWVLEQTKVRTNKNTNKKSEYQEIVGYYPTLSVALKDSVRYQIYNAETKQELFEVLDKLNNLFKQFL